MKKIVVNVLTAILLMVICIGCGGGGDRMRMTVEGSGEVRIFLRGSGTATIDWGDGSDRTTHELNNDWGTEFSKVYARSGRHTITITGNDIIGLQVGGLTSLDVRRNPKLMRLQISGPLTSLDLSNNTALTSLEIWGSQLTSLDLRNNTALGFLRVHDSQLTSLDLSRNTALTGLNLESNQLASLNVSNSAELRFLLISDNQLTSLDMRNNIALRELRVSNNQLTASALNALFESLPPGQEWWDDGRRRSGISIGNNPGANEANRSIATAKGWYIRN